ncbi:unnamed protein product [Rhizoctonia solani]|uniref:Uncharacterized protein n=1 Tax=Rhizoctonia solani TaxID=456999 RepID=A0A8H3DDI9_9AGAM|nr:unnamed protein product [Rhizoctonia solani]
MQRNFKDVAPGPFFFFLRRLVAPPHSTCKPPSPSYLPTYLCSQLSMATPLKKSSFGIPQVLLSQESDDEPDPEDEATMDPGGLLVAYGPHIQPTMPTLVTRLSPNTLDHNAGSFEAHSAHAIIVVAANAPVGFPLTENGQLQHSLIGGGTIISGDRLAPDAGVQSMPLNNTASLEETNTVASQDCAGSFPEDFVPASKVQESDNAAHPSRSFTRIATRNPV